MTTGLRTLQVRSRQQWRTWLAKHHTSSPGDWLGRYKAHTGVKSIPYEDTVREALCFGWIDSLVRRLDDDLERSLIARSIPQAHPCENVASRAPRHLTTSEE